MGGSEIGEEPSVPRLTLKIGSETIADACPGSDLDSSFAADESLETVPKLLVNHFIFI